MLESHNLSELSNQGAPSLLEKADSQLSRVRDVASENSVSRRIEEGAFKKPKKKGGLPELH